VQGTQSKPRLTLRGFIPVVAPLVIGLLFFFLGSSLRGVVLFVIAGLTLVLVLLGVEVERYLAQFGSWIANMVGLIASLIVGVILVLAGWATRLLRRDPLTPKKLKGNSWHPAASRADSDFLASAPYGLDQGRTATGVSRRQGGLRGFGRGLTLAAGAVTLLLLVDLGIGLAWGRVAAPDLVAAQIVDRVNFTGNTNTVADPRASSSAMKAYPWADEYFREIQTTPSSYWPFTESRPSSFQGKYVTIKGWSRATYEPKKLSADAPVVWMFGGSTTWGEGQRDDYTIASYLARIAQDAGTPIRVVNYGQRGWTHFQEMILFEQLLASEPAPDVAIFYDGANETNAQTMGASGVPTHTLVSQYAALISGGIDPEFAPDDPPPAPPSAAQVAWKSYLSNSAIQKLVRLGKRQFDTPVGAAEARPTQSDGSSGTGGTSTTGGNSQGTGSQSTGVGPTYVTTLKDAERALDVYGRGRKMTTHLAEDYGVTPIFFWQPTLTDEVGTWANENVSEPTINLSDALDGREDVFLDGGHTNEEGARIVAERIWREIAPIVKAPRVGPRKNNAAPAVPPAKPAPTPAQMFDTAQLALESAVANPCELGTWSSQLGALRVSDQTEGDRLVELAQKFLFALAEQMPPEQSALRAQLTKAAGQLPFQSGSVLADPAKPFFTQLPVANNPEFRSGLQQALAVQEALNRCN